MVRQAKSELVFLFKIESLSCSLERLLVELPGTSVRDRCIDAQSAGGPVRLGGSFSPVLQA